MLVAVVAIGLDLPSIHVTFLTIFWVVIAVAFVAAVLWALKTIVW